MTHNKAQAVKTRNKKNKAESIKKEYTGNWSSENQDSSQTTGIDRNNAVPAKKIHGFRTDEKNFHLLVDGVPYVIRSIPVLFNDELRFRIIINEAAEHLFTWDPQIGMLRAIDDDASVLPDGLELALSEKLQSQLK